jgi:hypothetical protein
MSLRSGRTIWYYSSHAFKVEHCVFFQILALIANLARDASLPSCGIVCILLSRCTNEWRMSDLIDRSDLPPADATFQILKSPPFPSSFLRLSVPDLPHATNGKSDRAPFGSRKRTSTMAMEWPERDGPDESRALPNEACLYHNPPSPISFQHPFHTLPTTDHHSNIHSLAPWFSCNTTTSSVIHTLLQPQD